MKLQFLTYFCLINFYNKNTKTNFVFFRVLCFLMTPVMLSAHMLQFFNEEANVDDDVGYCATTTGFSKSTIKKGIIFLCAILVLESIALISITIRCRGRLTRVSEAQPIPNHDSSRESEVIRNFKVTRWLLPVMFSHVILYCILSSMYIVTESVLYDIHNETTEVIIVQFMLLLFVLEGFVLPIVCLK